MIAFAVFLLLVIIGTRALKNLFKSPILSFVIALLIGAIASRGLNKYVIEQYIVGSPVSAAVFLIGVLPILALYGFIKKRGFKGPTKAFIWALLAFIYLFIFWLIYDSMAMGITYALFILAAGIVETVLPWWEVKEGERKDKKTGRFVGFWGKLLHRTGKVQEGAEEVISETNPPKGKMWEE